MNNWIDQGQTIITTKKLPRTHPPHPLACHTVQNALLWSSADQTLLCLGDLCHREAGLAAPPRIVGRGWGGVHLFWTTSLRSTSFQEYLRCNYSQQLSSACVASATCTSMGCSAKRRCGIRCRLVHSKGSSSQGILKIRLTPGGQVLTYVFELPYSRAQETEADEVSNQDFFLILIYEEEQNRPNLEFCSIWDWDSAFVWVSIDFTCACISYLGGSSLCCQSLLWCQGSASLLGKDATCWQLDRWGKYSASENCIHSSAWNQGRP